MWELISHPQVTGFVCILPSLNLSLLISKQSNAYARIVPEYQIGSLTVNASMVLFIDQFHVYFWHPFGWFYDGPGIDREPHGTAIFNSISIGLLLKKRISPWKAMAGCSLKKQKRDYPKIVPGTRIGSLKVRFTLL